ADSAGSIPVTRSLDEAPPGAFVMIAPMSVRESLQRGWITIGVPGTQFDDGGTYATYDAGALPAVPREVLEDPELSWLRALAPADGSMAPNSWSHATTPLTAVGVERLRTAVGPTLAALPPDLLALADPTIHERLWSATDAYVDAGDHLAPVPGG